MAKHGRHYDQFKKPHRSDPSPDSSASPAGDVSAEVQAGPSAEIESLKAEIEKLTAERDQINDQLMRALADHQNFRKRMMQERERDRLTATQKLVEDLLPVLDNFERSLAAAESGATVEALLEGVRSVDRQLRAVLSNVNLIRIDALGKTFDPEQHDAIVAEVRPDLPEGTVVEEIAPGYTLGGTVIRPARVKVSRES